jgi:hypothetical protein
MAVLVVAFVAVAAVLFATAAQAGVCMPLRKGDPS